MTLHYFLFICKEILLCSTNNSKSLTNKLLRFLKKIDTKIFEKYRNKNF